MRHPLSAIHYIPSGVCHLTGNDNEIQEGEMRGLRILAVGLLIAMTWSCAQMNTGTTRTQTLDSAANFWLSSKKDPPSIDVTGVWDGGPAMGGGWGEGRFIQTHKDVTGSLGLYNVRGVVSGDELYLLITSSGRIYYTAHLTTREKGRLIGTAVEGAIADEPGAGSATSYPIMLRRMSD
jgi:hypothetical protein